MKKTIRYTTVHPMNFGQVSALYVSLGWNSLNLQTEELEKMCTQSWFALYAFDQESLVGMGRVISDGVITGIICGLGVLPSYQTKGIGKELMNRIIHHCEEHSVIPQLMCAENLEAYYEGLGFERFSVGMTKRSIR